MAKSSAAKTVIIKIGSSTLIHPNGGLDIKNFKRIIGQAAQLIEHKHKVIIVTSGSIGMGTEKLGLKSKPKTIPEKQAAAAVGQSILMRQYEKYFEKHSITVAQILLTRDAIADRERYLNARNTINTLLAEGVVPVVNENDTVATEEIKVGDNDNLSALVASLVGADILLMLSDIDGFYMTTDEGVQYKADEITEIDDSVKRAAGRSGTQLGTGGMVTKLQAAKVCFDAGIKMAIIHGREVNIVEAVSEQKQGTWFVSKTKMPESRKRWLAHGHIIKGGVVVDTGAERALKAKGGSLLPAGIVKVEGDFQMGDTIKIYGEGGDEIGRGLSNYPCHELDKIKGKKSGDIPHILGYQGSPEAIHRDNFVLW
ncbi:MAG: glutamate 5-kinase [Candidatus Margulisiibacteriota bacterium]